MERRWAGTLRDRSRLSRRELLIRGAALTGGALVVESGERCAREILRGRGPGS